MNLIFDIGNTSIKVAVYDGSVKKESFTEKAFVYESIKKKLSGFRIERAIISSVREIQESITNDLYRDIPLVHVLSSCSALPFTIGYDTPGTLGSDRIAAVAGAFRLFPANEVMIIDAGTAITYEFLSGDVYKGGNISPGLMMRFRALNSFTGKLPLVSPSYDYTFPGINTNDAIAAGVITGMYYEINEYIRTFKKLHKGSKIILTGGDSGFLKEKINHRIQHVPDLLTDGLNYILNYNAK